MKHALFALLLALTLLPAIYATGNGILGDGTDPMPACRGKVCPPLQ